MINVQITVTNGSGNGLVRSYSVGHLTCQEMIEELEAVVYRRPSPASAEKQAALARVAEQLLEAARPVIEAPAPEPAAEPAPPPAAVEKPPTHADLRQALRAWQTLDPKNSAGAFLTAQGYPNVSAIPDDQIAKVLNALKEKS